MKKISFILSAPFFLSIGIVSGQGILFDSSFNSWDAVLQRSKQSNKPIFVDVYTVWCGPCRYMYKNIFPQEEVGKYFNPHFLSVRINAEKDFGISFSKQFHIDGYPTYLFLTPDGEIIFSQVGSRNAQQFIQLGRSAIKNYRSGKTLRSRKKEIQEMENKLNSEDFNLGLYENYIKKMGPVQSTDIALFERYLSHLSTDSLFSEATYDFVSRYYRGWLASNSAGFKVLLDAYKNYPIRSFELMQPWYTLNGRLLGDIKIAASKKDILAVEDIVKSYAKLDQEPDNFRMDKEYVHCAYFARVMDSIQFSEHLGKYIEENVLNEKDGKHRQEQLKRYRAALKLKFGVEREKQLNQQGQWFAKSYFCNYRLILVQLLSLKTLYTDYFQISTKMNQVFDMAMQTALKNYVQFSPNFNENIIQFFKE